METRKIFQEKAKDTIDFVFDNIEKLEAKTHHMTETMKMKMGPQLENLKIKRMELEKEFKHLKEATAESWEDAKLGFEKSADIMHKQIDKMREHFRNQEKSTV